MEASINLKTNKDRSKIVYWLVSQYTKRDGKEMSKNKKGKDLIRLIRSSDGGWGDSKLSVAATSILHRCLISLLLLLCGLKVKVAKIYTQSL